MRSYSAFLLFVVCISACKQQETRAPLPHQPSEQAVDGGRVTRRLENDVATLNYLLHTTDYERYVLSLIHDPLVDLDRNLLPIPGTAASWEVGDGGRSLTFHLDPRATFSDGQPVRPSDSADPLARSGCSRRSSHRSSN